MNILDCTSKTPPLLKGGNFGPEKGSNLPRFTHPENSHSRKVKGLRALDLEPHAPLPFSILFFKISPPHEQGSGGPLHSLEAKGTEGEVGKEIAMPGVGGSG